MSSFRLEPWALKECLREHFQNRRLEIILKMPLYFLLYRVYNNQVLTKIVLKRASLLVQASARSIWTSSWLFRHNWCKVEWLFLRIHKREELKAANRILKPKKPRKQLRKTNSLIWMLFKIKILLRKQTWNALSDWLDT